MAGAPQVAQCPVHPCRTTGAKYATFCVARGVVLGPWGKHMKRRDFITLIGGTAGAAALAAASRIGTAWRAILSINDGLVTARKATPVLAMRSSIWNEDATNPALSAHGVPRSSYR